jgi:V/A-type H+-transporting ATPase subunit I
MDLTVLRAEEMKKIKIICLKSISYEIISYLHEKGVLHLKEAETNEYLKKETIMDVYDDIIKSIYELNPIYEYYKNHIKEFETKESIERVGGKIDEEITKIRKIFFYIEEKRHLIEKLNSGIKKLEEIEEEIKKTNQEINKLKVVTDFISYEKLPESLSAYLINKEGKEEKELSNLKEKSLFYKENENYLLLFFKKENGHQIKDGFRLPHDNPEKLIKELENKIIKLENEKKDIQFMLKKSLDLQLIKIYRDLLIHKERAEITKLFSGTKTTYVIEGWLPEKEFEKLKKELEEKFGGKIKVIEEKEEHEIPPTLMKENKLIKNYEIAYDFSTLPNGKDWNAAFFYFFTFPFFYGMILGDVGYSLISIIIAYSMKKLVKSEKIKALCNIWLFSSIFGLLFGIAYDEWFGASHVFWLEKMKKLNIIESYEKIYNGLSRVHEFEKLLLLCIVFGLLHINIAYILSIINSILHKDKKHALTSLGWLLLFSSPFFYYFFGVYAIFPFFLGIILLVKYEGVIGLIELPSLFSVPASYMRIAAVGIAGVIMAEIINAFLPNEINIENLIAFIFLIFLHSINAFIAMFESTVQAGRLQILEFGTRFIKGGGYIYKPFMIKR